MSWTIILAEIRHALELPTSVQIRYSENKPAKNGGFVLFETNKAKGTLAPECGQDIVKYAMRSGE